MRINGPMLMHMKPDMENLCFSTGLQYTYLQSFKIQLLELYGELPNEIQSKQFLVQNGEQQTITHGTELNSQQFEKAEQLCEIGKTIGVPRSTGSHNINQMTTQFSNDYKPAYTPYTAKAYSQNGLDSNSFASEIQNQYISHLGYNNQYGYTSQNAYNSQHAYSTQHGNNNNAYNNHAYLQQYSAAPCSIAISNHTS